MALKLSAWPEIKCLARTWQYDHVRDIGPQSWWTGKYVSNLGYLVTASEDWTEDHVMAFAESNVGSRPLFLFFFKDTLLKM